MSAKIVYWQDDGWWLGYLAEYPDYVTQGETLDELKLMLLDILQSIKAGYLPSVNRTVGDLEYA